MRNTALTILFMLACMTCGAQINRSFLGCTIGESDLSEVRGAITGAGYTISEATATRISIKKGNVKFSGGNWAFVDLTFTGGLLNGMSFMNCIESYDEALAFYEQISALTKRSYGSYTSTRKSVANDNIRQCQFFDGKTLVWMTLTHYVTSPYYYVFLRYSNSGE